MSEIFETKRHKRKTLTLLMLLISSALIATASAAVYNLMYMQAMPISVQTAKVIFANGDDASEAGTTIGTNGTYVKFTSLSGWPNATRVYENASVIKNVDNVKNFECQLSRDSWSGDTDYIDELYVKIYDASGTWKGTVDVKTGDSTSFTIPHGEIWRVEWSIKWKAETPAGSTVTVTLALMVTGEGTSE